MRRIPIVVTTLIMTLLMAACGQTVIENNTVKDSVTKDEIPKHEEVTIKTSRQDLLFRIKSLKSS